MHTFIGYHRLQATTVTTQTSPMMFGCRAKHDRRLEIAAGQKSEKWLLLHLVDVIPSEATLSEFQGLCVEKIDQNCVTHWILPPKISHLILSLRPIRDTLRHTFEPSARFTTFLLPYFFICGWIFNFFPRKGVDKETVVRYFDRPACERWNTNYFVCGPIFKIIFFPERECNALFWRARVRAWLRWLNAQKFIFFVDRCLKFFFPWKLYWQGELIFNICLLLRNRTLLWTPNLIRLLFHNWQKKCHTHTTK